MCLKAHIADYAFFKAILQSVLSIKKQFHWLNSCTVF